MFLGIEIGGTKLQLGVGSGDGRLMTLERLAVNPRDGAHGILEQIREAVTRLNRQYAIDRMGIGFGGPVRDGRTMTSHQVDGWNDVALVEWCHGALGLPAVLGNDCDAAALAEATLGAGAGCSIVFYVTVGTGIGGGLVVGGRLHGQDRPAAAEIGHLRPGLQADQPSDTVESLASGPGIAAGVRNRILGNVCRSTDAVIAVADPTDMQRRLESAGMIDDEAIEDLRLRCAGDLEQLTAQHVAQAAAEGNLLAAHAIDRALEALGWAVAQTVTLVAPEVVVVGGGVSLIGEQEFYAPLRRHVSRFVFGPLADSIRIVAPTLGEEVVVHGAIALAQKLV